ncbi:MAG: PEP/pyruvate-binding domain-containing protein [Bradyrhizobiaceae bacterium]|nr:PEP/pyruvate-binding domain-containing protein [Bradyrhizobiaceae bacterium]
MLRWIDDLDDADCAHAGPKMARLGALRRHGFEVPDGFAVTVAAFQQFIDASGLGSRIESEMAAIEDPNDTVPIERASASIRQLIEQSPFEASLSNALVSAYEELCFRHGQIDLAVAVRSSATGEDSAGASYAGQYESYLGIMGADNVLDAVRKAWSSLFAERALSYRLRRKQHHRETPMGVGVLRLLHARCAGVGFSAHPVTGKRDRIVIEGTWGLGEALVQGLVEPDHIEIDKSDGRIIDYRVGDKKLVSAFDPAHGKVAERNTPERFRRAPCLTDDMIDALWRTVRDVEGRYGYPVDLEWVIENPWQAAGRVAVVQVRPITAIDHVQAESAAPRWNALDYATKYGMGLGGARRS